MSGVQVGTRLQRLYQLRDRIALEIAAEERQELLRVAPTMPLPTPAQIACLKPPPKPQPPTVRVPEAAVLREWARGRGIPVAERGRVSATVIDEYIAAGGQ